MKHRVGVRGSLRVALFSENFLKGPQKILSQNEKLSNFPWDSLTVNLPYLDDQGRICMTFKRLASAALWLALYEFAGLSPDPRTYCGKGNTMTMHMSYNTRNALGIRVFRELGASSRVPARSA